MKESFAPGVVIDGKTYYPTGWMYIFAYAIKGVKWAIEECEKEEFQKTVKEWLKEQHNLELEAEIEFHMRKIEELRKELL